MAKALTVVPELAPNARRIRYGTVDPGIEPRLAVGEDGPGGPMTIGYLGRLHPKKNLVAAIRAMTRVRSGRSPLRDRWPALRLPCAELQATVEELNLGDRVSFHPPVFDDQKFVMLRRWDWLILPSLQENFGQVLAQALSVGTPVIVSERIDTCEAIVAAGLASRPELDPMRSGSR